jgi:ribosome maturation factor RimP
LGGKPFFYAKTESFCGDIYLEDSTENIESLVAPTVEALGCRIWGVELQGGFKNNLKVVVYIDSEDGISVEDCATVSEHVSDILDMEELVPSPYVLEVSSPGLDRILFKEQHFKESLGLNIDVRLNRPYEGRKKLTGVLLDYGDLELILRDKMGDRNIPVDAIRKVRLVPEI